MQVAHSSSAHHAAGTASLAFTLEPFGPFPHAPHLAVALSGGADSMALALLADAWARARGGRITALTVDHGLRAESAAEAQQVAQWMQARGIAHHTLTPPLEHDARNLQESARERRYNALAEWCRDHEVLHCLLGHHAGDQRETIALMTARGDTADGNCGMSAARNYRGVRFLRPLLTLEKETLEDFLRAQEVAWVEDPSNQNPAFARVRIRTELGADEAARNTLTQHGTTAAAQRRARDAALANAAMRMVTLHPQGFAELDYAQWHALDATLASQLVADLLTTIGGHSRRPRGHETTRLCEALHRAETRATLHGCDITRHKSTVRIARELARCEPAITINGEGQQRWDNRFHVRYALPTNSHFTLRALGAEGQKQLGSAALPSATPSLWHLDELCFVPHMYDTLPAAAQITIGFEPAKPLAAAPFWCLN